MFDNFIIDHAEVADENRVLNERSRYERRRWDYIRHPEKLAKVLAEAADDLSNPIDGVDAAVIVQMRLRNLAKSLS